MDFRIWGGGGVKVHFQKPRNPLTDFGGINSKAWGLSLSLGPSDTGLDCGKAWEIGLSLGPNDPRLDCGQAWEIRRQKIPHG